MSVKKSNAAPEIAPDTSEREIIITRVVNAPREQVFAAFTDVHNIAKWWGPNGFTNTIYEMNVKPGGVWRYMMHGPDGVDYPNKVVYIEVVNPERLVYEHGSDVADLKDDPHHFHVTITFAPQDDKTLITLRSLFNSAEHREAAKQFGAVEGGQQTLARLDAHLKTLDSTAAVNPITVRVTRRFSASAEQVFDAWLNPEHVGKWLFATPTGKMVRIEIDARVGGRFVIVERRDGVDAYHSGEYLEINRPRRLAFSFALNEQLADAAHVQIDIVSLQQGQQGCELTLTQTLPPKFAEYASRTQQGWTTILETLGRILDQA